jgi:hypothetical protein
MLSGISLFFSNISLLFGGCDSKLSFFLLCETSKAELLKFI